MDDEADAGIIWKDSVRLNIAQQEASKNRGRSTASMANGVVAGEELRRIELQTATNTKDALGLIDTEALKQDYAVTGPSPSARPAPIVIGRSMESAPQLEELSAIRFSRAESDLSPNPIEADLDIALDSTIVDFDETPPPIQERKVKRVARKQSAVTSSRSSNRPAAEVSDFAVLAKRTDLKPTEAEAAADKALNKLTEVTKLAQQIAATEAESIEPATARFPLEKQTTEAPVSTFSLNVSDVSFRLAAASLNQNVLPLSESIRPEEFFNALPYHDLNKHTASPIRVHTERARFEYGHRQELLRIGVKTRSIGRHSDTPLNLVLLIDNSGSMERPDRQVIVRRSLESLLSTLSAADHVSMIAFARQPRLWADGLAPNEALSALDNFANTTPEGGTNLENALTLAYATAKKHYQPAGQNRVILFTDGAANLGNTSAQSLSTRVETHRQQGIALDCFGIGFDGYEDHRLEALTRNGDGRYAFLNDLEQVENDFIRQLSGALNVAAKNVKVQIAFNPLRVTSYRQIGYAKHQMKKEQFRDNRVDAAELAAEESGTALYVLTMNPEGSGPVGDLIIRYQSPETGQFQELNWSLPYAGPAKELEDTSQGTQLATAAALFAERLAGIPYSRDIPLRDLESIVTRAAGTQSLDPTISQLKTMILQAESLSGF